MDWRCVWVLLAFISLTTSILLTRDKLSSNETIAAAYLSQLNTEYSLACNENEKNRWNYMTDITPQHQAAMVNSSVDFQKFQRLAQEGVGSFTWEDFSNKVLKREYKYLSVWGPGEMSEPDVLKLTLLESDMETIYSTGSVCPYNDQSCSQPSLTITDLNTIFAISRDYEELSYYWQAWRNATGLKMRGDYAPFVTLSNQMAVLNGFNNTGQYWQFAYGDCETCFREEIRNLWLQVEPLYSELYKYVRRRLSNFYGEDKVSKCGRIPAHVLGDMWAQTWVNIENISQPFDDAPVFDVTPEMVEQGYTVDRIFETAEEFFESLGLPGMTETFWNKSSLSLVPGVQKVCQASAEDFCLGPGSTDFRINMCTQITMQDLVTAHHEMGHIEYFMAYTDLDYIFRNGANPGFHEAIGDTMALSVQTPYHMKCVLHLLNDSTISCDGYSPSTGVDHTQINYLYHMALDKVAFLPFAYVMDHWRWGVFNGSISSDEYNTAWWDWRETIQQVEPPVPRSNNDFDPGAKYHIAANVPYIRYFVSYIVQFQFYEALCRASGEYDGSADGQPLHMCDFGNSTAAGKALLNMLDLGFSVPWEEALSTITNGTSNKMDATAILNYFQPLYEYLLAVNAQADDGCQQSEDDLYTHKVSSYLKNIYENASSDVQNNVTLSNYNYECNLTSVEALNKSEAADAASGAYFLAQWENHIHKIDGERLTDPSVKRQVKLLSVIGSAALPPEYLSKLQKSITNMSTIYSTAKICPYTKPNCDLDKEGLSLDPDIETLMSSDRSPEKLRYLWLSWRDQTGRKMIDTFEQYVQLSNMAATANGFSTSKDMWLYPYEDPQFSTNIESLWQQLKPLYLNLHAYVRRQLSQVYPGDVDVASPIPAHLLGNMWAQDWQNILPLVLPYPSEPSFNATPELITKTPIYMFKAAEEFFTSIGLPAMPSLFWNNSLLTKPTNREVTCHASAWDFSNRNVSDYRIKMCTKMIQSDFVTIHHEMGHIQYYQMYRHQPFAFREGANPGFHEAIGDTVALSAANPIHLSKVGLLDNYKFNKKSTINYLMQMALEKVAFLPYAYIMDLWRWEVFEGLPKEDWNRRWWELREQYQGVVPPVARSEEDFDPGAKYHITSDYAYISYFVSHILQFQFHRRLCEEAGQYNPQEGQLLHECDIYRSKPAGQLLGAMLSRGSSTTWQSTLEAFMGTPSMDTSALLEYFQPLTEFLEKSNRETEQQVGWQSQIGLYIPDNEAATEIANTTGCTPATSNGTLCTSTVNTDTDETVPIVVGAVLGVLIIVVLIAYVIGRRRQRKSTVEDVMDTIEEETQKSTEILHVDD